MYAAINNQGHLIYASQIDSQGDMTNYYCPHCGQIVKWVQGKNARGRAYFRHLASAEACRGERIFQVGAFKKKPGGESALHQAGKLLLYQNLVQFYPQVSLEEPLEGTNQIADIYLQVDQVKIVLEWQVSPIRLQTLTQRHQSYLREGYQVFWLTALESFDHDFRRTWPGWLISYNAHCHFHLLIMDVDRQVLRLYHKLPLLFCVEGYSLTYQEFSLQDNWLDLIAGRVEISTEKNQYSIYKSRYRLNGRKWQEHLMRSQGYRSYLMSLYQAGILWMELPEALFYEHWYCPFIQEPMWYVLAWYYHMEKKLLDKSKIILAELLEANVIHLQLGPSLQNNRNWIIQLLDSSIHFLLSKW